MGWEGGPWIGVVIAKDSFCSAAPVMLILFAGSMDRNNNRKSMLTGRLRTKHYFLIRSRAPSRVSTECVSVLLGSRPPLPTPQLSVAHDGSWRGVGNGVAAATSSFNIDFGERGRRGVHGNTMHFFSATDMSLHLQVLCE